MTDNPIDIPALIASAKNADNVRECLEMWADLINALERAQSHIVRLGDVYYSIAKEGDKWCAAWKGEKARADAAEAALDVALHDAEQERKRGTEARKQAFQCAMERDAAREALLAGLAKAEDLVATAAARGHDGWDNAGRTLVKAIRAALAATPPAAEPAGQGEQQEDGACTSCGGSGKRDHLGHACVPCFGTGKQQEVL